MEEKEVTKADIKQFIRDVTSCGYYNRKIISLTNQLEAIHVQLVGVKSIAPKEYHIENKIPFSMQGINSLLIDEENLLLERDKYIRKINDVRVLFDQIPLEVQTMMMEIYCIGLNHTKTAKNHKMDRSTMYRNINKEINKILKKK